MAEMLYFVCSNPYKIDDRESPGALLRIKTPTGMPNIAFNSIELGNKFLFQRDIDNEYYLVANNQINEESSFNFNEGVLIFESEIQINSYNINPETFNYSQCLSQYQHHTLSKYPW